MPIAYSMYPTHLCVLDQSFDQQRSIDFKVVKKVFFKQIQGFLTFLYLWIPLKSLIISHKKLL